MALQSWHHKAKWALRNYCGDSCTIECRYFKTKKEAQDFAKDNGCVNYTITRNKFGK